MAKVTNISTGPRGGYTKDGVLVMVDPGEEADLEDANDEWFAKSSSKAAKKAAEDESE